jgi:uncharacterized protein YfaT (DUF1175 family)
MPHTGLPVGGSGALDDEQDRRLKAWLVSIEREALLKDGLRTHPQNSAHYEKLLDEQTKLRQDTSTGTP